MKKKNKNLNENKVIISKKKRPNETASGIISAYKIMFPAEYCYKISGSYMKSE